VRFVHGDEGYVVALDQVARARGIPRAQVEKDYFVTHVLWALHATGLEVWFKGGTCLSKGYGIISRFSEDLDLKIESGAAAGMPPTPNWKGERDSHIERRQAWFASLASTLHVPGCSAAINEAFADERHRSVVIDVRYPGALVGELGPAIRPWVRLEVGSARVTPYLDRRVTSWLHDHAVALGALDGLVDNRPSSVRCIHPLVTLIEKLDAMMRRWEREDLDPVVFVRHWEDAAAVIVALPTLPACPTPPSALVEEMLAARQIRERPRVDHPAFNPRDDARSAALLAGHRAIAGMFFGDRPRRSIGEANEMIRAWIAEWL
jgi:hypothetical protein